MGFLNKKDSNLQLILQNF